MYIIQVVLGLCSKKTTHLIIGVPPGTHNSNLHQETAIRSLQERREHLLGRLNHGCNETWTIHGKPTHNGELQPANCEVLVDIALQIEEGEERMQLFYCVTSMVHLRFPAKPPWMDGTPAWSHLVSLKTRFYDNLSGLTSPLPHTKET